MSRKQRGPAVATTTAGRLEGASRNPSPVGIVADKNTRRKVVRAPEGDKILIRNKWGRIVGYVQGGVFYDRLRSDQFYRDIPGITKTLDVLEAIRNAGGRTLHITNTDTGTVYVTSLENFLKRASEPFRNEWGVHRCLPYEYWEITEPERILQERMW